ncbi:MAG: histidinol dehydrogenase, partial [Fibrobacter sp.]|nr:histidinol dehydrogenase [Fibrobacter sp.]
MSKIKKIPVITYPGKAGDRQLQTIFTARQSRDKEVSEKVEKIIDDIREHGDEALLEYTKKFDGVTLTQKTIRVSREELSQSASRIKAELKAAINEAAKRIKTYHKKQVRSGFTIKTREGKLSQIIRPLNRVGVYIPGGKTIYPSSVLMDIIPAQIAGVKEIVAVTPPRGELDPGIAYALSILGIEEIYRCGGSQIVAALAYGTKTIKRVDKIVGPGNQYVTAAKRLVFGAVDIDSLAGPSEVTILADSSVSP